jgi:hypothetical protein
MKAIDEIINYLKESDDVFLESVHDDIVTLSGRIDLQKLVERLRKLIF